MTALHQIDSVVEIGADPNVEGDGDQCVARVYFTSNLVD